MGCAHCYALPIAQRHQFNGSEKYADGFKLTLHPELLKRNFNALSPSRIFVNSMSDLMHEQVPLPYIQEVFSVIAANPKHLFLVLTKRAELLHQYNPSLSWPANLLMGVTVEHRNYIDRIRILQETDAIFKVIFFEPLLGDIGEVDLTGIRCTFVGGESGVGFRPVQKSWVQAIHQQCIQQGVPFVFKGWGGYPREANGCLLDGIRYDDLPTVENCLHPPSQGSLF